MGGPENEEYHEHVVCVPEALVVRSACLLHAGEDHGGQCDQHDVARPARSGHQVGKKEAVEAKVVLGGDLRKVVPVSDGVDPAEEENGPSDGDVEGDVLVELDDAVEWRLAGQGDECPADGEQNHGHIEVEYQSCRSSNHVRRSEGIAGSLQTVLHCVVDEAKCKHHGV